MFISIFKCVFLYNTTKWPYQPKHSPCNNKCIISVEFLMPIHATYAPYVRTYEDIYNHVGAHVYT